MTYPLTELRDAVVALLKPHFQFVYGSRAPRAQVKTPCVMVYLDGRRSEQLAMSPVSFKHTVNLVVAVCVQANDGAEMLAEKMLGKVEQVLYATPDLHLPNLAESVLPSALNVEYDDTGEITTVFYQQVFRVVYFEEMD